MYQEYENITDKPPSLTIRPVSGRKRKAGALAPSSPPPKAKMKISYAQWTKAVFSLVPLPSRLPEDISAFQYRGSKVAEVEEREKKGRGFAERQIVRTVAKERTEREERDKRTKEQKTFFCKSCRGSRGLCYLRVNLLCDGVTELGRAQGCCKSTRRKHWRGAGQATGSLCEEFRYFTLCHVYMIRLT